MVGFKRLQAVNALLLFSSLGATEAIEATEATEGTDYSLPSDVYLKNTYIVTMKDDLPLQDLKSHVQWVQSAGQSAGQPAAGGNGSSSSSSVQGGGVATRILKTFNIGGYRAYGGQFSPDVYELVKARPEVVTVRPNRLYTTTESVSQENAPWGLATMSSREPGGSTYTYDSNAGQGTFAYVLDSGVNAEHQDFGGRVIKGADCSPDEARPDKGCDVGTDFTDKLSHGTHVSGIIGGTRFGVAKKTTIVDVKTINNDNIGTSISTLAALEWAFKDMESKGRTAKSVINMSIGAACEKTPDGVNRPAGCPRARPFWGDDQDERRMIEELYKRGVLCVVAAGNDDTNAAWVSPANAPNALTVGAINKNWEVAGTSNFGPAVDLFAPGVEIESAGTESPTQTLTKDGTSMAAPHVAGLALYLKGLENIVAPGDVSKRVKELATKDGAKELSRRSVAVKQNSPNLIANNGIDGNSTEPENGPPVSSPPYGGGMPSSSSVPVVAVPSSKPASPPYGGGMPADSSIPVVTVPSSKPASPPYGGGMPASSSIPVVTVPSSKPASPPYGGGMPASSSVPVVTVPSSEPASPPSSSIPVVIVPSSSPMPYPSVGMPPSPSSSSIPVVTVPPPHDDPAPKPQPSTFVTKPYPSTPPIAPGPHADPYADAHPAPHPWSEPYAPEPEVEPKPYTPTEPKPYTPVEPKPYTPVEPKPYTPKPYTPTPPTKPYSKPSVEPKPYTPTEPKPYTPVEPKPYTPKPYTPTPPTKPYVKPSAEPKPYTPTEPKPSTPVEPKPYTPRPYTPTPPSKPYSKPSAEPKPYTPKPYTPSPPTKPYPTPPVEPEAYAPASSSKPYTPMPYTLSPPTKPHPTPPVEPQPYEPKPYTPTSSTKQYPTPSVEPKPYSPKPYTPPSPTKGSPKPPVVPQPYNPKPYTTTPPRPYAAPSPSTVHFDVTYY